MKIISPRFGSLAVILVTAGSVSVLGCQSGPVRPPCGPCGTEFDEGFDACQDALDVCIHEAKIDAFGDCFRVQYDCIDPLYVAASDCFFECSGAADADGMSCAGDCEREWSTCNSAAWDDYSVCAMACQEQVCLDNCGDAVFERGELCDDVQRGCHEACY